MSEPEVGTTNDDSPFLPGERVQWKGYKGTVLSNDTDDGAECGMVAIDGWGERRWWWGDLVRRVKYHGPTLPDHHLETIGLSDRYEVCEPGTAARLRRMERIARKYRRRWYRFALICESANFPAAARVCLRAAIAFDDILSA